MWRLSSLLLGTVAVWSLGCARPDPGSAGTDELVNPIGEVNLAYFKSGRTVEALAATAGFFGNAVELDPWPADPYEARLPVGSCGTIDLSDLVPGGVLDTRGTSVTLSSPDLSLELALAGQAYQSQPLFDVPAPLATAWDVEMTDGVEAGFSWERSLRFPGLPHPTSPATIASMDPTTISGAIDLAWTPLGADGLILVLDPELGDYSGPACHVADSGAFTFPAESVALAESKGYLRMLWYSVGSHELDGRPVLLQGVSEYYAPYEKP